jgi:hypothetical protein
LTFLTIEWTRKSNLISQPYSHTAKLIFWATKLNLILLNDDSTLAWWKINFFCVSTTLENLSPLAASKMKKSLNVKSCTYSCFMMATCKNESLCRISTSLASFCRISGGSDVTRQATKRMKNLNEFSHVCRIFLGIIRRAHKHNMCDDDDKNSSRMGKHKPSQNDVARIRCFQFLSSFLASLFSHEN